MVSLRSATVAFVLSLGALAVACGGGNGDSNFGDGNGDDGGGGGGGGLGGGGFGGGSGNGEGGTGGNGNGDGGVCNAPVDMYIMFDRSGSMGNDCNIGDKTTSKWCRSINALSGYFNGMGSKDQAAAIQFFPVDSQADPLCTTGDTYNVPALPAMDFTTLPTNSFDSILNSTKPGGGGLGTPTEGAIRGLTRFTAANRRPGRVTIGILITDGDPNGCDENLTHLSDLLDAHYKATTIRTYVIGMQGATFGNLEKIAAGGNAPTHPDVVGTITDACGNGNGPCLAWNVGTGDPAVFTAALAAIQDSANGCKPGGGTVNPPK